MGTQIKSVGEVTVQAIYTFTLGETPLPSTENEEQFKSIVSSTVAEMIGGDAEVTVLDYWVDTSRSVNLVIDLLVRHIIECSLSCADAIASVNSTATNMKETFVSAINDNSFASALVEAAENNNLGFSNTLVIESTSLRTTEPEMIVSTSTPTTPMPTNTADLDVTGFPTLSLLDTNKSTEPTEVLTRESLAPSSTPSISSGPSSAPSISPSKSLAPSSTPFISSGPSSIPSISPSEFSAQTNLPSETPMVTGIPTSFFMNTTNPTKHLTDPPSNMITSIKSKQPTATE